MKVHFNREPTKPVAVDSPSTCIEAEPFALRVLDDSMQPEFKQGCVIVIDPTGHARDGSFVLARQLPFGAKETDDTDGYVFRRLAIDEDGCRLEALNSVYPSSAIAPDLSEIVGVVVQRAGTRRRYHKRYD